MRRISTETNLNYYIKYEYNQFDQLVNCRDGNTNEKLIQYIYDQYGRLIRMTNSDGSRVEYDYYGGKTSNYVKKIQSYFSTNETIKSIEYVYNQKGQRTKMIIDSVDVYTYRYDSIGQIIYYQREFNNKSESSIYNYDKNFNRKQVSNNGTNSIYLTNSLNQYVQIESRKLEYDDLGNLINDGVHTYKYNSESKCVQIDDCKLKYDHFNNINSIECSNGKTTRLLVDPFGFHGFDVISEITTTSNDSNTNQEIIHYLNSFRNGLFGMRKNDQLYYYLFDIDSNVISLFKNNIIYNDYSYDPFGKVISSSENLKNRFKFSAKYGIFELSTNIYLNRARLYDSCSSRFLSMDPSGIMTSSYNLYVYCNNNPLDYKDTDGKIVLPFLVAGSIIGSITNTAVYGLTVASGLESFSLGGLTGAALNGAITGVGVTGGAIIGGPLGIGVTFGVGAIAGSGSTLVSNAIDNKPSTVSSVVENGLLNGFGALLPTTMLGYQGQGATSFGKIPTKLNTLLGFNKKYKATAKSLWKTLTVGNIIANVINQVYYGIKDWIASFDPNDIIGPDSYGDRNFVSKNELFIYKIRFENDENATAPAQKVFIKYNPSEYLDIKTFRLLSFGYDDYVYEYNYPTSFSQMMLDYSKDTTFKIRFQAGINIISSEITWLFESIDILTGLPPKNPEIGFLPPNNGTSGQGYVMFSLNVKKDTSHMSQIDAEADIVFDMNEPIITPKIFHTIDDRPPFIELYPNTDLISQGQFAINLIKSDNGSGVESVDLYEYDKTNNSLLFLLNTIEDLAILPLRERKNYVLTAIGRDFVGNIQNVNDIFKLDINFDYKIDCPNNCSQNGICNYDTGVCKCDTDYILTDCSFFYDGDDENYFDFKVFISNYNDKSFDLNFNFKSIYNFDNVKLIISGFPIETNFSSNYSLDNNQSLVVNSFDSLNVNLPSEYFGDIKLIIELQLKYLLIEFTATREIDFFVSDSNQSFVALFLITNIECLSNNESELSFVNIDYSYDLIGNQNNESNITISLDLISLNENFNFTVLNDFNYKNGSIELTFSDLSIFLTIQANISFENDVDNIISVDRAISLENCNKLINNQTTSTISLITNENEISTNKDGSNSIFTSKNTESSDLNTLYFTNDEKTSTSKLTTINLNNATNLNDDKKGSSNKTLIIVLSISAVVILIVSITSIYFFKKKKKLRSTLYQIEMSRFSEKF
jgi:RHS repeat-associated protein